MHRDCKLETSRDTGYYRRSSATLFLLSPARTGTLRRVTIFLVSTNGFCESTGSHRAQYCSMWTPSRHRHQMAAAIKRDAYLLSLEIPLGSSSLARKSVPNSKSARLQASRDAREKLSFDSSDRERLARRWNVIVVRNRWKFYPAWTLWSATVFSKHSSSGRVASPFRIAAVFQWAGIQQSTAQRDPLRFRRRSTHQQFRFGLPKRQLVSRRHLSLPPPSRCRTTNH